MKKILAAVSFLGVCGVLVGLSAITGCAHVAQTDSQRDIASVDHEEKESTCPQALFQSNNPGDSPQLGCREHFAPDRAFHRDK